MEEQTISLAQILQVGGLSSMVGAISGGIVSSFLSRRDRNRKAKFVALKISLILEAYYMSCVDRVYALENYLGSSGHFTDNKPGLPDICEYPENDAAWLCLDRKIAEDILNFPATIAAENSNIMFLIDMDANPEGPDPDLTLKPLYEIMFSALSLARLIREKHGLGKLLRTQDTETRMSERQERFLKSLLA